MREMEIPPFPRKFDNPDLGDFLRQRLSQTSVLWPEQAIPLVGRSAVSAKVARAFLNTCISWVS